MTENKIAVFKVTTHDMELNELYQNSMSVALQVYVEKRRGNFVEIETSVDNLTIDSGMDDFIFLFIPLLLICEFRKDYINHKLGALD